MKPNDHFVSYFNGRLEVIEKKKNNDQVFLKSMGSNANLSDRNQARVWSVLQGMINVVKLRYNSQAKTLVCDK